MNHECSAKLLERAERVIPGGVNSGNRLLSWPLVAREAAGAYFTDLDGNRYLDYHAAFGPLVLGHNHPGVNAAVRDVTERLDLMGVGVTEPEVALAEKLNEHVPSAERILLTNSGRRPPTPPCAWRGRSPAARRSSSSRAPTTAGTMPWR